MRRNSIRSSQSFSLSTFGSRARSSKALRFLEETGGCGESASSAARLPRPSTPTVNMASRRAVGAILRHSDLFENQERLADFQLHRFFGGAARVSRITL